MEYIKIYGAGLAGCEAAYQAAKRGAKVKLYEMKPQKYTPAHSSPLFAELVCSNSLRSDQIYNAVGLLKEELRMSGSLIIEAADKTRVEAGSSLAVDRVRFSEYITDKIKSNENIEVITEEVGTVDADSINIIATGPLTSNKMSDCIKGLIGENYLHFFDAAAPIIDAKTINYDKVFLASRYDKGEAAYINCPMTREEYVQFYTALITAEEAQLHDFETGEELTVFEGCMPIEVMAKRGEQTMLFGPLKPVGLTDPKTGKEPFAVVQLRSENKESTMYNIVGFQTHLKIGEQKRVFSMIPGLENAEFLRYGVMHRNTFINSPKLLTSTYCMREKPNIYFAGQMTGVEGYVESAASGFVCGINAQRKLTGKEEIVFSPASIIGSMANYISSSQTSNFQPMNANFGIVAPIEIKIKGGKKVRVDYMAKRAIEYIKTLEL